MADPEKQAMVMPEMRALVAQEVTESLKALAAFELDVDCISDGETTVVGAILEHVEPAGCHSGDSASVTPPQMLSGAVIDTCRAYAHEFAQRLHVCGLMNLQLAVTTDKARRIRRRGT